MLLPRQWVVQQHEGLCFSAAEAGEGAQLGAGAAAAAIDACAAALAGRYDARHGGFGGAPKFPRTSELSLLLVQALRERGQKGGAPGMSLAQRCQ